MKRNPDVFNRIWECVIEPEMLDLSKGVPVICPDFDLAKNNVWESYCEFNEHVSNTYLMQRDGQIDRHKVAACYICAIMDAMPLDVSEIDSEVQPFAYLSNERLAVTTAVSVLGMFDFAVLDENSACRDKGGSPSIGVEAENEVRQRVASGIDFKFEYPAGNGSYYDSVLCALSFMKAEGTYNVPLLALIMFHWERSLVGPKFHEAVLRIRESKYNTDGL